MLSILLGTVACICGLWSGLVRAQPDVLRFRRLSDEEGLPNNLFRMAIQAKDGLIWMAGIDGLACYDGHTVQAFRHMAMDTHRISGKNIQAFAEDADGRLLAGTIGAGLYVSDPGKTRFMRLSFPSGRAGTPLSTVYALATDSTGRTWVGTDTGLWLVRHTDQGTEITAMQTDCPLPAGDTMPRVTAMMTDRKGRVFVGTVGGLYVYDVVAGSWTLPSDLGVSKEAIFDFTVDLGGRIWVSCAGSGPRLYVTAQEDLPTFRPYTGIPLRAGSGEIRMAVDHDNTLWVSAFGDQVYAYDLVREAPVVESTRNSDIPHERFFRKPMVDHTGDVWLPCEGFYILPYPKGFRAYRHPLAFHQSSTAIAVIGREHWFAYREEGLVRVDRQTGEWRHMSAKVAGPDHLPVDHIQRFTQLRDGRVVLAGFGSIIVLDQEGRLLYNHRLNGTNRAIYEDKQGRLWVGGYHGLHLMDAERGVLRTYVLPPILGDERNFIQAIAEDDQGRIWFGSDLKGLAMLDPRTERVTQLLPVPGDTTALPSLSVIDMDRDEAGQFWLATDIGLVRLDPNTARMTTYGARHGLVSDYITAVLCTRDGRVWVSTHEGIAVFDPDAVKFTCYSRGDGLANLSYYPRNKCLGPDGTVYFGGRQGVDYFDPRILRSNAARPRMHLAFVKVNDVPQAVRAGERLELRHADKLIECAFTGLYYTDPGSVRYVYRVEGLHDDWIELGTQRHVVFAALAPGEYVFRAKAVTLSGMTSAEELVLPFTIRPPFYGTLAFRSLVILLLGAAILYGVHHREQRIRARDRREAEVNRKMVELEKRALQSQMNPHFIYNSMNSIQHFMIGHDVEGAMRYLTRFSRILRTVLNLSAQNRVPLTDEIKLIEDYLELENMRFPNRFEYRIDIDPSVPVHALEIPPFLIQPQVENAVRHGLLRKPTPGHVRVRLRMDGQDLVITVEDDGIGRQAAARWRMSEQQTGQSRGLGIVRERLYHLHGGHAEDSFTITDLHDADGHPSGTRVEIKIPLD